GVLGAPGPDRPGRLVAGELARRGVELVGPVIEGRTGVVVSLADGVGRSMLTDRGIGPRLAADTLRDDWLLGCNWLPLPAHSLVAEPGQAPALAPRPR